VEQRTDIGLVPGCFLLRLDVCSVGIPAGEDDVGALGPGASSGFEPDAGAAADQHDGLSEQLRFALGGSRRS
jgi:hypothetical protein